MRKAAVTALQSVFEVLDGRRPCEQLTSSTSVDVYGQIVAMLARRGAPKPSANRPVARVRRVHLQLRRSGSAEYFGTVERAGRVRAFAGRIELVLIRRRGRRRFPEPRWVLTEFTIV